MPSSTRPATPGPSNAPKSSKRTMSDVESAPQDPKKARVNSSAEPSIRRDSNRDARRRRRRKKKAPVVNSAAKNEATQRRPDEHSRAPLSARNEIIRFASAPSEASLPASIVLVTEYSSQALLSQSREGSQILDDFTGHRSQGMPSILSGKERTVPTVSPPPGSSPSSLEERVAQLEAELKSKNNLIASHQALLNQVQQAVTCQVCLDLMYKSYALAPCGHLACHSCLVNWFTASSDNQPAPPALMRRKTCPHCRAVVRARPVEVWGVKGIAQAMGKSGLLQHQLPVSIDPPECLNTDADPWKDIFPKPETASHHGFPWFFPDADVDDDDVHIPDVAPRGEDVGMLDMEDGGIYRCLDCMHEIWDGVCSNCGRVYPGHRPDGDEDDEGEQTGWLEDQAGAEEVDVADDPGWMGLEEGEADDGGDMSDWHPWRRPFHNMFVAPWGFLGTIRVDEEEEDTTYGRVDDLRLADQDEESGDEGYESSFIDDGDEEDEIADLENRPRIYEISDDHEDENYGLNLCSRIVHQVSDEDDDEEERFPEAPERGWPGHRYPRIVSSDEDADELEDEVLSSRPRQAPRFIESDGSDANWSDG